MFKWFEDRLAAYPDTPLETPPAGLLAFYWHYTRPAWKIVTIVAVLSAIIAMIEVAIYGLLGVFVDWLASQDRATFFDQNSLLLIVVAVFLLIIVPLVHLLWELVFHQSFAGNFPMSIRWRAHRYLLGQSLTFFQDDMAGRLANTVMQTALAVRETVNKVSDVCVYFLVYVLSTMALLISADWRLALPLAAWMVAYAVTGYIFIPLLGKISQDQADTRSVMTGRVVDSYTNMLTVKLFAHSDAESAYARDSMEPFLATVHRQMRTVTVLNTLLHLENYLLLAAIAGLSIVLWQQDAVSIGAIAVAIGLVLRMQGMSQWILWETAALFEAIGTVRDGVKTLSRPLTVVDAPSAKALPKGPGRIEFDAVRFGYGRNKGAVDGLTLSIAPGEKVGIVGRSGAGKSTLVSLLLRLYDLEGGSIRIDGVDIATVQQESLREKIGMVTQDTALLHRSVADNIRYGRPDASDDEVEAAARGAQAHEFILGLEDAKGRKGYAAHVGERGVKLSGGQRQRIAIARVFLKNAPILVLDEATSALDSEIESAIQDNLAGLTAGKTVIAIAHRLSTIAAMDRLVVLDKGRVVEEGTHAALIARGGIYADLWARQSGGFIAFEEAAE